MNAHSRVMIGLTLSIAAATTHASTQLGLLAAAETGTPQNFDTYTWLDPLSSPMQQALAFGGSTAFGAVDLGEGTLRASAHANNDAVGIATFAQAGFADALHFTSGIGATAYLEYAFHGELDVEPNPKAVSISYGTLNMVIGGNRLSGGEYTIGMAEPYGCSVLTSALLSLGCTEASAVLKTGRIPFEIQEDNYFDMSLVATAGPGSTMDLSNTARFYLVLPEGAAFTSNSGRFLTGALPISPVPEPAPWALLAAGVAVLAGIRRRRAPQ
tara:strand:+ start:352 stop:1161 length:810 start_codon:yes stop_codon:yes gene_type:complete